MNALTVEPQRYDRVHFEKARSIRPIDGVQLSAASLRGRHDIISRGAMQTADATVSHNRDPLLVDLALQGGGAHGAFTWGVLDRLLEEPWLQIAGISGTSAGAMNSAVLVHGHSEREPRRPRCSGGF